MNSLGVLLDPSEELFLLRNVVAGRVETVPQFMVEDALPVFGFLPPFIEHDVLAEHDHVTLVATKSTYPGPGETVAVTAWTVIVAEFDGLEDVPGGLHHQSELGQHGAQIVWDSLENNRAFLSEFGRS